MGKCTDGPSVCKLWYKQKRSNSYVSTTEHELRTLQSYLIYPISLGLVVRIEQRAPDKFENRKHPLPRLERWGHCVNAVTSCLAAMGVPGRMRIFAAIQAEKRLVRVDLEYFCA